MNDGISGPPKGFTQGGFEDRFCVSRRDGQPINPKARYLILDYSGRDPHAILALKAYAKSIRPENERMAEDILNAIANPIDWPAQHD